VLWAVAGLLVCAAVVERAAGAAGPDPASRSISAVVRPGLLVALQQPAATDEFVPIGDLPPTEQLPAAPLLVSAYIFIWLALIAYVVLLWRRLTRVEGELTDLSSRLEGRRKG
jgi:CcmD family protein